MQGWCIRCDFCGLFDDFPALTRRIQTLVSSILLRPDPRDPSATALSNNSGIRQQVEMTRMHVVRWMRNRWVGVHQEGGFDRLEGWALKELSHGMSPIPPRNSLIRQIRFSLQSSKYLSKISCVQSCCHPRKVHPLARDCVPPSCRPPASPKATGIPRA